MDFCEFNSLILGICFALTRDDSHILSASGLFLGELIFIYRLC